MFKSLNCLIGIINIDNIVIFNLRNYMNLKKLECSRREPLGNFKFIFMGIARSLGVKINLI